MTTVVTRGAASAQALGYASSSAAVPYIEDVFSTYLYTGNGSTQTITNGIDLSGKGGLVWCKQRDGSAANLLYDTNRGAGYRISSDLTDAQVYDATTRLTSFTSSGFTLGNLNPNGSGANYASWTFREQPKFFDVVTYTGNGVSGRAISHNLGSAPGCLIVKCTSNADNWYTKHRSLAANDVILVDSTAAAYGDTNTFGTGFTFNATTFQVGNLGANESGRTYVAYLFAHDAGGFGLTGTDNVISCGSFTADFAGNATVSLGYEPQWVIVKAYGVTSNWFMLDNMRGMGVSGTAINLFANTSGAETSASTVSVAPQVTGFDFSNGAGDEPYIYIAIRRGPMKVPTDATTVFAPVAYTGTNVDNRLVNTGISTDMAMARIRTTTSNGGFYTTSRLTPDASWGTAITDAANTDPDSFMTPTVGFGNSFSAMNGFGVGNDATRQLNQSSTSQLAYAFRRAPSFFDVVCYTGTGSNRTQAHNLGVVPELIMVKNRAAAGAWDSYSSALANTEYLVLNTTAAKATGATRWNSTTPTASVFSLGSSSTVNGNTQSYIAYLFASAPGVSKVGSYTGTGTTQTINCGFTAGSRFVMIKRTDSTGDWYVWDSARGIVAGNDPYLLFNSTAAEVTGTDYVDTAASGFEISSTAPAAINANGGSFIFLAIA